MNVMFKKVAIRERITLAVNMFFTFSLIVSMLSLTSCNKNNEDQALEEITGTVDEFAEYYFNFDLNGTIKTCTPESKKWLSFLASNIRQEDIDILKAQKEGSWHETGDIIFTSDSTVNVECKVFNFLKIDTLGRAGSMTEHATYKIPLVKRNGKWKVKMEAPLQSEKRSHD